MSAFLIGDILFRHPLFGLGLTLAIYGICDWAWRATDKPAALHPVLTSVVGVGAIVVATGVGYDRYFSQAAPLHHALGLLVILLAVPLARQWSLICEAGLPLAFALLVGSAAAFGSALALPASVGSPEVLAASIAPKSATAAVAVGISDRLGGIPGLTAVVVIMTGIFGAIAGPTLLRATGVKDERAAGFALGLGSHAIGSARAFQISERAGAFASVGMILNAILTVVLAPLVLAFYLEAMDAQHK